MIEKLVKILKIFHSTTVTLLNENITLPRDIPLLLRSIFVSSETLKDLSTTCSETANAFTLKLKKRFIDFERKKLLSISTLLDPKFENKVFSSIVLIQ